MPTTADHAQQAMNVKPECKLKCHQHLLHPLMQASDPYSILGCLDALDNAAGLLDLLGSIDITGEQAQLSPAAANAYFWLTKMLRDTVRHSSNL